MQIEGYASIFNTTDYLNDIILPCSFTDTINNINNRSMNILYEHNFDNIIGKITDIYENEIGLFVKGLIYKNNQIIINQILANVINGLSIGYIANNFYYENEKRIITNINLLEVSIVKNPANKHCKINYSYI